MGIDRRRFVGSMTFLGAGAMLGVPRIFGEREQTLVAFPEPRARGEAGDLGLAQGRGFAAQIK
jgi:hypothetical protein